MLFFCVQFLYEGIISCILIIKSVHRELRRVRNVAFLREYIIKLLHDLSLLSQAFPL